jgi:hypothetical protein
MSKVFKSVGKVFKKVGSAVAKTVKKVVKSKAFKVVAAAALVYFGGAALISMANGGTAAAGIGSAWTGASTATTQVLAGNFSNAASAIGSGWTGAAKGAATFAQGQAASTGLYSAATAAPTAVAAPAVATPPLPAATVTTPAVPGGAAGAGSAVGSSSAVGSASPGLFNLGEMGKAALITSGMQMAGSAISGAGQDKSERDARDRATYAGVNNVGGNGLNTGGLFQPLGMDEITPQWQPTNIDELIQTYRG